MPSTVRAHVLEQFGFCAAALDEGGGDHRVSLGTAVPPAPQAVGIDGGDGEDAAVVEWAVPVRSVPWTRRRSPAGVAAVPVAPGGADQLGSVQVTSGVKAAADAVGKVFAVGMGEGQGHDRWPVRDQGMSAATASAEAFAVAWGEPRSCSQPWLLPDGLAGGHET